jgi:hypothetical protein
MKLAKMISRKGYWGTTCSSKCGYCDNWPRHNKTSVRRQEREQWLEEADLDGYDPDPYWEDITYWDSYFLEWQY